MHSQVTIGGAQSPIQLRPLSNTNKSGQSTAYQSPPANTAIPSQTNDRGIPSMQDIKLSQQRGDNIPISDQQLVNAIERAIKAVQGPTTSLDFSIHRSTKQIMVKVLDKETGEVIREVPPEKSLDLLAKLWEMAGILVDVKR